VHEAKGRKGQTRKEKGTGERGHDYELRMMKTTKPFANHID
jgi:hypothetical protein